MEYLRCELFHHDQDAAVDFYRDVLGFVVERDERNPTGYVSMRRGGVVLGLGPGPAMESTDARRPLIGVELVLVVDDLAAARENVVAHGWRLDEDIVARPWGLSDFRLLDPEGYYWRLTEEPSPLE
jgi:lactoylglutathione lyase